MWELPPEPTVRAVRDRDDRTWTRENGAWKFSNAVLVWWDLLRYGPLTDASEDHCGHRWTTFGEDTGTEMEHQCVAYAGHTRPAHSCSCDATTLRKTSGGPAATRPAGEEPDARLVGPRTGWPAPAGESVSAEQPPGRRRALNVPATGRGAAKEEGDRMSDQDSTTTDTTVVDDGATGTFPAATDTTATDDDTSDDETAEPAAV